MNNFQWYLTPFLYCLGPRVAEPKKWLFPNFVFKGWEWCIWTMTTIIHHQIWSADSTAKITVIQSSKLSTLRSTFGRVPLNFFNCSGWNYFNFYIYFWISLKNLDDLDVWPPFQTPPPLCCQFWTLDDCNVSCWADGTNPIMDFDLWALGLSSPMKNKKKFLTLL